MSNSKIKIVVLGPNGMLGQIVSRYFKIRGYPTCQMESRFDWGARQSYIHEIAQFGPAVVINCIGKIKQKSASPTELLEINSILPALLADRLGPDQYLIQPSTDCVFSGLSDRPYRVSDVCDADDDYGTSKRLAEVALAGHPKSVIVRVSIVGTDSIAKSPRGLLGWFLSQPESITLGGYIDHYWNGITTLEWCKSIEKLFLSDVKSGFCGKTVQLGSPDVVSKYELLTLFRDVYQTRHSISPTVTGTRIYRVLSSDIACPPLRQQLSELRYFSMAVTR